MGDGGARPCCVFCGSENDVYGVRDGERSAGLGGVAEDRTYVLGRQHLIKEWNIYTVYAELCVEHVKVKPQLVT